MQVRNSVSIVTGANRGLGRELVIALLKAGAGKVYAGARDPESLTSTTALDPLRVIPLRIDVTNAAGIAELSRQAPDVNLLINNAGVMSVGGILDIALETIDHDLEVNYLGPLRMTRAFVPVIESNGGGAIVNILTIIALASFPGFAAYNASKAAAWSMTQSLRASVASRRIAVHGVFPGGIDTDMLAGIDVPKTASVEVATAIVGGIEAGQEDIFPDAMSAQVYAAWRQDHKAVERQLAAM